VLVAFCNVELHDGNADSERVVTIDLDVQAGSNRVRRRIAARGDARRE